MRFLRATCLAVVFALPLSAQETVTPQILEAYPSNIQARTELRTHFLHRLPKNIAGQPVQQVITIAKRWNPGQVVRVAFLGGDSALQHDIADATKDWTSQGNIQLDFGFDPATNQYRHWSPKDANYTAEIRVSFNYSGYWSAVGTDSVDRSLFPAYDSSLNLEGFDVARPSDWRGVVLHEFGHALGFEHEHQHPEQGCDAEFRWDDDPGYIRTTDAYGQFVPDAAGRQPGIYTVLGGPPNEWPRNMVDFNLKQLPDSHAYYLTAFDRASIMKYYFPAWMFVGGSASHCFSAGENNTLSPGDKAGVAWAYPAMPQLTQQILGARSAIFAALAAEPKLPAAIRETIGKQATDLQNTMAVLPP